MTAPTPFCFCSVRELGLYYLLDMLRGFGRIHSNGCFVPICAQFHHQNSRNSREPRDRRLSSLSYHQARSRTTKLAPVKVGRTYMMEVSGPDRLFARATDQHTEKSIPTTLRWLQPRGNVQPKARCPLAHWAMDIL